MSHNLRLPKIVSCRCNWYTYKKLNATDLMRKKIDNCSVL